MSSEHDSDLVSLLSQTERDELVRLIHSITESMRTSLSNTSKDIKDPPKTDETIQNLPQSDEAIKDPPKTDETIQNLPQSDEAIKDPPQTEETTVPNTEFTPIQKAALESFDKWRGSVISRIKEVLHPHKPLRGSETPSQTSKSQSTHSPDAFLATHYPPHPTTLTSNPHTETILQSLLLLCLSLKSYDARSRVLLLHICSSLSLPLRTLLHLESTTALTLLQSAKLSASTESASRAASGKVANTWKIGLASVAGAALVGITGGLAAPLVAAGVGSLMGGLGLGATAVAGYLGAVASSGAVVGTLFGLYGGRMGGQAMERYAKEVSDFEFLPIRELGAEDGRLRVAIGVTGWLVNGEEEVVEPWKTLGDGVEGYALRWEVAALTDLGRAMEKILTSYAMGWVKKEIIKRTVLAALYSALWPMGLLKAARVVDNPFSIAKQRSEKAGLILADAIINKTQGERPVTLVGYSLGARVVYFCLLELAQRGAYGLVENVVLMGAAVPANKESWKTIRSVVAGRVVNVYSEQDYVLAFLYRTSSIQLGVAGLQEIKVRGVENVNVEDTVEGHLRYRYAVGRILGDVLKGDTDMKEVEREEHTLKILEKKDMEKDEEEKHAEKDAGVLEQHMEKAVQEAEKDLEERRKARKLE
ncbi:Similar to Uncharacterized membrane protein C6F6.13c; acc. no. Q9US10 [Pyronema omphalodes CBS 100304]|uniref:Similar to Uncharacterized membrane protein C6F6.13c acc. no. Q9US10 n=1 Tax=Pyronema omphalodes (strain CBS 100304) TaxID=1076935 RepID=U4LVY5_PYROM|nr:Similar to Uncharacterized membrane protein C6F6.13c; acc. no. Q9US10 [Pyronema omphalodes CBS 100304]